MHLNNLRTNRKNLNITLFLRPSLNKKQSMAKLILSADILRAIRTLPKLLNNLQSGKQITMRGKL